MSAVSSFYSSVVNEVIENLKTQFNEEGIDPAALNDLKELWEKKIKESGALDPPKNNHAPPANQFTSMMQSNGAQGNMMTRMTVGNAAARLIKPSGQGTVMNDQGFTGRVTIPVFQMQSANPYRGIPMVINTNQPQNVNIFGQYHNVMPNQVNINQIMTDNGVVNLRKNQTDGTDDRSSDEEEFVNVSEADPLSVKTPYLLKQETKEDDSDEDACDDNLIHNSSILQMKQDDDDDDDDEGDDDDKEKEDCKEEAPLNSEDDISDDDPDKIFETDNVIVCQYEKVSRTRNKWKLNFVSGIANLYGKDTVFHKAVGEAEW